MRESKEKKYTLPTSSSIARLETILMRSIPTDQHDVLLLTFSTKAFDRFITNLRRLDQTLSVPWEEKVSEHCVAIVVQSRNGGVVSFKPPVASACLLTIQQLYLDSGIGNLLPSWTLNELRRSLAAALSNSQE
jgi:hypothetical protein